MKRTENLIRSCRGSVRGKNSYEHEIEVSGRYLPKQDLDSGETLGRGVAGRVLPKAVSYLDLWMLSAL